MTTPLPNNAQALFNRILPKGGADMAIIRETHDATSHKHYLIQHLPYLKQQHHLGGISNEHKLYMNVFVWAYRDGIINDTELTDAMKYSVDPEYRVQAGSLAALIKAAKEQNIPYFFHDTRTPLTMLKQQYDVEFQAMRLSQPERFNWDGTSPLPPENPFLFQPRTPREGRQADASVILRLTQLLKGNPHYAQRLAQMEQRAEALRDEGIPQDVISAIFIAEQMPHNRNTIVIPGAAHTAGIFSQAMRAEGILDDALAAIIGRRGGKVHDGIIMDAKDLSANATFYRGQHNAGQLNQKQDLEMISCATRDQTDFVYNISTDRLHHPPQAGMSAGKIPTLTTAFDSAVKAQKLRKDQTLNPDTLLDALHQSGFDLFSCGHIISTDRSSPLLPSAQEKFAPILKRIESTPLNPHTAGRGL